MCRHMLPDALAVPLSTRSCMYPSVYILVLAGSGLRLVGAPGVSCYALALLWRSVSLFLRPCIFRSHTMCITSPLKSNLCTMLCTPPRSERNTEARRTPFGAADRASWRDCRAATTTEAAGLTTPRPSARPGTSSPSRSRLTRMIQPLRPWHRPPLPPARAALRRGLCARAAPPTMRASCPWCP